jgi:hypothetical protein
MVQKFTASDLKPGDIVRLKKAHPCGGFEWLVNRVGGDIGLRCQTCDHHIMIPRFRIDRRIREIVRPDSRPAGPDTNADGLNQ